MKCYGYHLREYRYSGPLLQTAVTMMKPKRCLPFKWLFLNWEKIRKKSFWSMEITVTGDIGNKRRQGLSSNC
jgi:hypothetical protein